MRQENETTGKRDIRKEKWQESKKVRKKRGNHKYGRKTYVDDIDRSVYDIKDEEHDAFRIEEGLTPEIVDQISKESMTRNG